MNEMKNPWVSQHQIEIIKNIVEIHKQLVPVRIFPMNHKELMINSTKLLQIHNNEITILSQEVFQALIVLVQFLQNGLGKTKKENCRTLHNALIQRLSSFDNESITHRVIRTGIMYIFLQRSHYEFSWKIAQLALQKYSVSKSKATRILCPNIYWKLSYDLRKKTTEMFKLTPANSQMQIMPAFFEVSWERAVALLEDIGFDEIEAMKILAPKICWEPSFEFKKNAGKLLRRINNDGNQINENLLW